MQPNRVDCPAWESAGNTVGSISNVGYGVGLASAPANIVLGTPGSGQLRYISDGTLKLPVVEVHVLDQAGHLVTPGSCLLT